jgi:hypothetical protein
MTSPFCAYENVFSLARTKHVHLGTCLYNQSDMQRSMPHDIIVLFTHVQFFYSHSLQMFIVEQIMSTQQNLKFPWKIVHTHIP